MLPSARSFAMPLLTFLFSLLFGITNGELDALEIGMVLEAREDGDISPRYFMEAQPVRQLARQQVFTCRTTGQHICTAELGQVAGAGQACCPNDQYCQFRSDWTIGCCVEGSGCAQPCSADQVMVNETSTIFITPTRSASPGTAIVPIETSFSVWSGCSQRKCPGTSFLCPELLGGKCCPFGQACATGGGCLVPATSTASAIVPTQNSCGTSNMFECGTSMGGGCCTSGQTCVGINNCKGTPTGPAGSHTASMGLSDGAKAGIGVGVALAAAIVIGALTWFSIRRRREATLIRQNSAYRSVHDPQSPNGPVENMTEVSGPSRVTGPHQTGLVYDYFGPDAVAGPYTEQDGMPGETPSVPDRGVPLRPRGPSDIAVPIELDSRLSPGKEKVEISQKSATVATPTPVVETEEGPFELWGSPGSPSPMSPADERSEYHSAVQTPGA